MTSVALETPLTADQEAAQVKQSFFSGLGKLGVDLYRNTLKSGVRGTVLAGGALSNTIDLYGGDIANEIMWQSQMIFGELSKGTNDVNGVEYYARRFPHIREAIERRGEGVSPRQALKNYISRHRPIREVSDELYALTDPGGPLGPTKNMLGFNWKDPFWWTGNITQVLGMMAPALAASGASGGSATPFLAMAFGQEAGHQLREAERYRVEYLGEDRETARKNSMFEATMYGIVAMALESPSFGMIASPWLKKAGLSTGKLILAQHAKGAAARFWAKVGQSALRRTGAAFVEGVTEMAQEAASEFMASWARDVPMFDDPRRYLASGILGAAVGGLMSTTPPPMTREEFLEFLDKNPGVVANIKERLSMTGETLHAPLAFKIGWPDGDVLYSHLRPELQAVVENADFGKGLTFKKLLEEVHRADQEMLDNIITRNIDDPTAEPPQVESSFWNAPNSPLGVLEENIVDLLVRAQASTADHAQLNQGIRAFRDSRARVMAINIQQHYVLNLIDQAIMEYVTIKGNHPARLMNNFVPASLIEEITKGIFQDPDVPGIHTGPIGVDRAIQRNVAEQGGAKLAIDDWLRALAKVMQEHPELKVDPERMKWIQWVAAAQDPTTVLPPDVPALTRTEKLWAGWMRRLYEIAAFHLAEGGTLSQFVSHYIHRSVIDGPKDVTIDNASKFWKKRSLPDFESAEREGWKFDYNLPRVLGEYWRSFYLAQAPSKWRKLFTKMLVKDRKGRVLPLAFNERPEGPMGDRYQDVGSPMNLFVLNGFDSAVRSLGTFTHGEGKTSTILKRLFGIKRQFQRVIMLNPLFHAPNVISDLITDSMHLNPKDWFPKPFKYIGATLTGVPDEVIAETGFSSREEFEYFAIRHGLNMAIANKMDNDLHQQLSALAPDLRPTPEDMRGIWGLSRKIWDGIFDMSDKMLWGRIVKNAQAIMWLQTFRTFRVQGMPTEEAAWAASDFTNTNLGSLHRTEFTKLGGLIGHMYFFARNWTFSNMRLVSGALGVGSQRGWFSRFVGVEGRAFRHKGRRPFLVNSFGKLGGPQIDILQREYIKHLIKGLMSLGTTVAIASWALSGMDWEERRFKPENSKWPTEEDPRHLLDINTGLLDNKSRPIFVTSPYNRYVRDLLSWFAPEGHSTIAGVRYVGPTFSPMPLYNKADPLGKTLVESIFNISIWRGGRPIVPQGATFWEGVGHRALYFARSSTPIGQYGAGPIKPKEGEVRRWYEEVLPALGVWVRKGVPGGRTFGLWREFFVREGYVQDQLWLDIEKNLQAGDIDGAVIAAASRGRVSRTKVMNWIKRYNNPQHYNFSSAPREAQVKFLQTLRPRELREFFIEMGRPSDFVSRLK